MLGVGVCAMLLIYLGEKALMGMTAASSGQQHVAADDGGVRRKGRRTRASRSRGTSSVDGTDDEDFRSKVILRLLLS